MNLSRLKGRVAMIIGSGKGIGKAIAHELAGEGAAVVVTDIDNERGIATTQELTEQGVAVEYIGFDIRDSNKCEEAVAKAVQVFGRLDILINNAGAGYARILENTTLADWDNIFAINLRSYFTLTQCAMPHLVAGGNSSIVFISSIAAIKTMPLTCLYGATKAGLTHFARNLAMEYAGRGVRVNVVAPSNIATDMILGDSEEVRRLLADNIPMKRVGKPEDVAKVVRFLVTDDASYVTGQVIGVTGGYDLM